MFLTHHKFLKVFYQPSPIPGIVIQGLIIVVTQLVIIINKTE